MKYTFILIAIVLVSIIGKYYYDNTHIYPAWIEDKILYGFVPTQENHDGGEDYTATKLSRAELKKWKGYYTLFTREDLQSMEKNGGKYDMSRP